MNAEEKFILNTINKSYNKKVCFCVASLCYYGKDIYDLIEVEYPFEFNNFFNKITNSKFFNCEFNNNMQVDIMLK